MYPKTYILFFILFICGCASNPSEIKKTTKPLNLKDYYYCVAKDQCKSTHGSLFQYNRSGAFSVNNQELIKEQLYQSKYKNPDITIEKTISVKELSSAVKKTLENNNFQIKDFRQDNSYLFAESIPSVKKEWKYPKWQWKELYFVVVNISKPPENNYINITYLVDHMNKSPLSKDFQSSGSNEKEVSAIIKTLKKEINEYLGEI